MSLDSRQKIVDFIKLSGSTGSHTIARQEQILVREVLIEVTLDGDTSTRIDLNSVGLLNPTVLSVGVFALTSTAGNWETYDSRITVGTPGSGFIVEYNDANHATNPYSVELNVVGTEHQSRLARLLIRYLDTLP